MKALIVSFFIFLCAASHAETVIFVSPNGNDRNDGLSRAAAEKRSGKGPVASFKAALEIAAKEREGGESVRIVALPGVFYLVEPLQITSRHSGIKGKPLVIEAEKAGTVTLSGGYEVRWREGQAAYWVAATKSGKRFQTLWVNEQFATRARSPNVGSYYTGASNARTPVPENKPFSVTNPANIENTKALVLPKAAQEELRRLKLEGNDVSQTFLQAWHSWTTSTHRVTDFDSLSGVLRVSPESRWPFLRFGSNQRFVLENLPGMLDQAGEWWLSPTGDLRYLPKPKESIDKTVGVAPLLERVIDINGTPDRPVEHVVLRGLRISHSLAWSAPFIDTQAAVNIPAAVVSTYARDLRIENCSFEQIGGYALWLRKGSSANVIDQSRFVNLGAGGIRLGEAELPKTPADKVENNVVTDNEVKRGGRVFPAGVGIWIGQSSGNTIERNEVSDLFYTGISVGWTWGFGETAAYDNVIQDNYIHNIGQGVLSDLGGIYVLGSGKGTVIKNNKIEDVTSFGEDGATAWGIYLDEGASTVLVESNTVLRTTGGGFHLHYGRGNIVRKNLFGYGKLAQAKRTSKNSSDITFEDNEFIGGSKTFDGDWSGVKTDRNTVLKKLPSGAPAKAAGVRRHATF
jgi:parallel beta-helix repeat protein